MAAAVLCTQPDEFGQLRCVQGRDVVAQLSIGVVAVRIEQRRGQFDLKRLNVVQEIDNVRWFDALAGHQFSGSG